MRLDPRVEPAAIFRLERFGAARLRDTVLLRPGVAVVSPLHRPRRAPRMDDLWYKDAVFYEVHVKAFQDSNDDGIGDFPA